jgi:hypothetical protein
LFYDGGRKAKLGLGEALKNFFERDESRSSGIGQDTCGTGDFQSQRGRNASTSLFIDDEQAGFPMLPCECDR